jgi:serine/threonine protein kinase
LRARTHLERSMDIDRIDLIATLGETRVGAGRASSDPGLVSDGELIAGRYRVLSRIAVGGTAEVVAADDLVLGRAVAIKRPRADGNNAIPGALAREARVLARLRHPGVVRLYDHVIDGGRDHLVLEHVPGGTLAALRGGCAPAEVARIGAAVAEALAHVHGRGVVHLDLKAENVLLDDGGPRLIDFGISDCEAVVAGPALAGTPRAMAPEQIRGDAVDARTDLFALGVLLYELLAGRSPFTGGSVDATLRRVLDGTPAPVAAPGCASLADLVHHLLEKEPMLRPPCAAEVGVRLADIARSAA